MDRIILHVDFNSYFASVEQQDTPVWRGKPLGVCEHLGGIIIAASREAKQWGIKTGTPVWEAQKLYPKIILTKTHPDRYRFYTNKFIEVLEEYTDKVELYSIDEAFLDITRACNILVPREGQWIAIDPYAEAVSVAKEIKRRIAVEVGEWLSVSIGIGWNKLVAKIASDRQKPNGLVVFRPEEKLFLLQKIKLIDIPGIGRRQERNLNALGIATLEDLYNYPKENLITHFGIVGLHLWNMGQLEGSWKEGFTEERIKSMGHMYTLPKQFRKSGMLFPVLSKLSDMVGRRLRAEGLCGGAIAAFVGGVESGGVGGSHRLGFTTSDSKEIYREARALLVQRFGSEVRAQGFIPYIISVTVARLSVEQPQSALFSYWNKRKGLMKALDAVVNKHGESSVMPAQSFLANHAIRDSVGFGRVKELNSNRRFKGLGRFK